MDSYLWYVLLVLSRVNGVIHHAVVGYHFVLEIFNLFVLQNHIDAATCIAMHTDMYTRPENKYHILEISISSRNFDSNITRYCLINFHYSYRDNMSVAMYYIAK